MKLMTKEGENGKYGDRGRFASNDGAKQELKEKTVEPYEQVEWSITVGKTRWKYEGRQNGSCERGKGTREKRRGK